MYFYKSPIGPMVIKFDSSVRKYLLIINEIGYGHFTSPQAAADDVYMHSTGCDEWDELDGEINNVPTDIYEWEKINVRR